MLAAHLGEKPHRDGARVGAGLIGIIGELLHRIAQIEAGIEVELMMIGAIPRRDLAKIAALVEAAPRKSDRKCFKRPRRFLRGVVKNGGRIEAAAGPYA